jgi:uncharacterized cupredoxin-like copper-binding protein
MAEAQKGEAGGHAAGVSALVAFIALLALTLSITALVVALANRNHVSTASSEAAATVPVSLTDFKIGLASATLPAGKVTLQIANQGSQAHELLVFATGLDPSAFPRQSDGSINEDGQGLNKISDGDNLDPGGQQTRTVDLTTPGRYVLVCNLPGHFAQGMYAAVTVQ